MNIVVVLVDAVCMQCLFCIKQVATHVPR